MIELQDQFAQSRGGFTTQERHVVKGLMVDARYRRYLVPRYHGTTVPWYLRYQYLPTTACDFVLGIIF